MFCKWTLFYIVLGQQMGLWCGREWLLTSLLLAITTKLELFGMLVLLTSSDQKVQPRSFMKAYNKIRDASVQTLNNWNYHRKKTTIFGRTRWYFGRGVCETALVWWFRGRALGGTQLCMLEAEKQGCSRRGRSTLSRAALPTWPWGEAKTDSFEQIAVWKGKLGNAPRWTASCLFLLCSQKQRDMYILCI